MKNIIYSLVVVTAFFTVISCGEGGVLKSSTPSDVAKNMIDYIINEDLDGFIAISANTEGKVISEKDREFTKSMMGFIKDDIEKKGGLKEVIINEEKISEDGLKAIVKMQLVYNNGKKAPEGDTELIKVKGVWKIESL